MKHFIYTSLIYLSCVTQIHGQNTVKGNVTDEKGNPLSYVNVFIKETLEGSSSLNDGSFHFSTIADSLVTLCAMMLGFENYFQQIEPVNSEGITIQMKSSDYALKEVEVIAGNFNLHGSSKWKAMNPVDIVTIGGSVGDLYNSLGTMPGTQTVGESGKLFIRGGDSRETQTYIDDMHVLNPYTTTGENEPVRGRYSPFMFEGMSFSLGGYDPEYSQGLSGVLPLTTKDESPISKYGINASSIGAGGGGTYAFDEGSASVNMDYQNMGPYYAVISDGRDWITPYQKFSASSQFRYNMEPDKVAKVYGAYDKIWYNQNLNALPLQLNEDNYYINSTYRTPVGRGYQLFTGVAFSYYNQRYDNIYKPNDFSVTKEREIHLKGKISRRYSSLFKLQAGMESMIRFQGLEYNNGESDYMDKNHSIHALYATGSFYFTNRFHLGLSSRLEYTTINQQWNYTPRFSLNYSLKDYHFSAIAGKYTQLPENNFLFIENRLFSENCVQYILSGLHQSHNRVYRIEAYYKDYSRLTCTDAGTVYSEGYGSAKGFDLFFYDAELIKNLDYRISYSLNFSERKYRDYPVADIPQFASRHNLSVSLRYNLDPLKSIIGLTNQYASGRPYHNPNEPGWMNSRTPYYNSLNLSWTYLLSKKVIIFGSASNLLGRSHVYNYNYSTTPDVTGIYQGTPVKNASDRFFFIGIFITLGGNTAYDVSNF